MTRVTFYVIESAAAGPLTAARFACRIADKAVSAGQNIYMHVADDSAARQLDDLLWTFKDGSFLAHERLAPAANSLTESELGKAPIWSGETEPPETLNQVIINLHAEVPLFFTRFDRLIEFVPPDDSGKQAARARYKFYRDRGYELESHTL